MKINYIFSFSQQILSGAVSAAASALGTYFFDREINRALVLAVGAGIFITSGFYKK